MKLLSPSIQDDDDDGLSNADAYRLGTQKKPYFIYAEPRNGFRCNPSIHVSAGFNCNDIRVSCAAQDSARNEILHSIDQRLFCFKRRFCKMLFVRSHHTPRPIYLHSTRPQSQPVTWSSLPRRIIITPNTIPEGGKDVELEHLKKYQP